MAVDKYGRKKQVFFTKYGQFYSGSEFTYGECVLFPSKDNRDWCTFKVLKKHKEFKPFQKVPRLDDFYPDSKIWSTDFYGYYNEDDCKHYLNSGIVKDDDDVMPYDGNEDKLGKIIDK